jgi:hypothetical protein
MNGEFMTASLNAEGQMVYVLKRYANYAALNRAIQNGDTRTVAAHWPSALYDVRYDVVNANNYDGEWLLIAVSRNPTRSRPEWIPRRVISGRADTSSGAPSGTMFVATRRSLRQALQWGPDDSSSGPYAV